MEDKKKVVCPSKDIGKKLFANITYLLEKNTACAFAIEASCVSKTNLIVRLLLP